jgi:molybdenum cofactor cytidylyltransferase|tara:strand:+ start:205 stop:780 length:576 start_codon:yes stop_codon:yes gene_type:complete
MISAILLAAGQSRRLIGGNKLIIKYKEVPLINHILKSLIKSKVNKIIIVLGYESNKIKKIILKSKKIIFINNPNYKKGISSSIKCGLKKLSNKNKGFIIAQSDMPLVTFSLINKIYNSIIKSNKLVHVLKNNNKIGNPIGFNIETKIKFKKIKGNMGARKMVKKLSKNTNFLSTNSKAIFKDLDLKKDFSN